MITSLLVVCTGNICRSPMAEALFQARAKEVGSSLVVGSAGIGAMVGYPPPTEAIELMAGRGLDISGHRGRQITESLARGAELILSMERYHRDFILANWPMTKGRVYCLGEKRNKEVRDPYRQSHEMFQASLEQIEEFMEDWTGFLFQ